jgi:AcrR family transcriptional regulator
VLDAAQKLFYESGDPDPPLDRVAERAGTSTRTLLRHFGSKEGLLEAATADAQERIAACREAEPGDAGQAVRKLVDHYEELCDAVVRRLADAERNPKVRRITRSGERMHREWAEWVFAPSLEGLGAAERSRRLALLASVTDVYTWMLLRRRYGLSRNETEEAIRGLVEHAKGDAT